MSAFDVRDLLKVAGAPGARAEGFEAGPAAPPAEASRPMPAAPVSSVVLAGTLRVIEFGLVIGLGVALYALQPIGIGTFAPYYLTAILGIAIVTVALVQVSGGYRVGALRDLLKTAPKLLGAWSMAFLAVAATLVFAKVADQYSRIWLASYYGIGLAALLAGRLLLSRFVAAQMRQGRLDRRTAIVGGGPLAEDLIRALEGQADAGIRVVGFFDDRADDRAATVIAGYPKLGTVNDLVAYARSTRLDLVVFTLPIAAEDRLMQMLTKLWVLPIDIRLSAQATRLKLRPRAYSYIGEVPVLDVFDKPIADWDIVVKGVFDRVVAAVMIVALAPVLITVALAVRLTSPGPILFRQKRHGFNNEIVEVLKFRSMYIDQCDYAATQLVTRDDPRVTRVGRIIRKTSLDELPQLFNVLKGELSLVGPRPHAINARAANTLYDQVVDGYFARHRVKPGITGWAQVKGWRGETDTDDKIQRRVEHDLYYIENWSVLFDIRILLATPLSLFRTQNAY